MPYLSKICLCLYILMCSMPINAQPSPHPEEAPRYTTVVRMGVREGQAGDGGGYGDYQGTFLMIETRPRDFTAYNYSDSENEDVGYSWFAKVFFTPRTNDDCAANSTPVQLVSPPYARVHVRYVAHKDYFHAGEQCGTKPDGATSLESGVRHKAIQLEKRISTYVEPSSTPEGMRVYRHKEALQDCFFEWQLPNALSIKDLLVYINRLRGLGDSTNTNVSTDNEFPYYCYPSVSIRYGRGVLNCATFATSLLKELGAIDPDYDPTKSYAPPDPLWPAWSGSGWLEYLSPRCKSLWKSTKTVLYYGGLGVAVVGTGAAAIATGGAVVVGAGATAAATSTGSAVALGVATAAAGAGGVVTTACIPNTYQTLTHFVSPDFMVRSLTNRYVIENRDNKSPSIIRTSRAGILSLQLPTNVEDGARSNIEASAKRVNYTLR